MSYNIVYAPELGQVVDAASGASGAIAAAEQQRFYDQLGEQQRQFDYGQMLRAEQIGLADAQSRAALGLRAYESDQYNALRRDQLGMNYALAQQEMAQQEAYRQAQIEQAQYQAQQQAVAAFAREHGAAMRQRQDQNFKSFITQLDAVNAAAQDGQIDNDQLQAAYARLEQESGFPVWLPDEMAKQEMFEAQAAQQAQVAETIAGAFAGVLQEGEQLPPASAFMVEGKSGEMIFDNALMWKEVQARRDTQRLLQEKQIKAQTDLAKMEADARKAATARTESQSEVLRDSETEFYKLAEDLNAYKLSAGDEKRPDKPKLSDYNFPRVVSPVDMESLPIGAKFVHGEKLYQKTGPGQAAEVPF